MRASFRDLYAKSASLTMRARGTTFQYWAGKASIDGLNTISLLCDGTKIKIQLDQRVVAPPGGVIELNTLHSSL